jgi:glucosyl-3-phosphoglycerate phosphatase
VTRGLRTVRFVRHGQSAFNAAFEPSRHVDPMIFDARLTALGHAQAAALADPAHWAGVELIVTSPLTRAIETALLIFAGHRAPIRVEALHRERLEHSCDLGRARSILTAEFEALDFAAFPEIWWKHDRARPEALVVESEAELTARVSEFRDWLAARPERDIAVVGHGTFLNRLTGHVFANCEVLNRADF